MSNRKFVILGERCSGTNFLEEAITQNFDITYTSEYGNKHFFCWNKYESANEDTIFIGIIRNPIYWLNSFSKELHHIPSINKNIQNSSSIYCCSIDPSTHIRVVASEKTARNNPDDSYSISSRLRTSYLKPK